MNLKEVLEDSNRDRFVMQFEGYKFEQKIVQDDNIVDKKVYSIKDIVQICENGKQREIYDMEDHLDNPERNFIF